MHRTFFRAGVLLAIVCSSCNAATRADIDGGTDGGAPADSAVSRDASADTAPVVGDGGATRTFADPTCAPGQAPISNGSQRGSFTCTPVGASTATPSGDWPDVTGARMPLVYVQPGATGDGSMGSPIGTIAEALTVLQMRGDGTIVLSRGAHVVATTITFDRSVTLLGVPGPMGTLVQPPAGVPAFAATASAGSVVALEQLTINKDTPHSGPVLRALGDGSVHLRDVSIDHSDVGIELPDTAGVRASLDAEQLTITNAQVGVQAGATNTVALRSFRIEDSRVGVKSLGSAVTAIEGMVHNFSAAGVSVDGMSLSAPSTIQLDRIALWDGDGYGAWLGGSMLTITATHVLASGVRATSGSSAASGIGLFVTTAHLDLDTNIGSDAQQALGSIIGSNSGTGIVLDNQATATVRGAYVASNGQSGVVVQATASVNEIGYSYFTDNLGAGLVVSAGGQIAGLLCNGFVANRAGSMQFVGAAVDMQDSVVIAPQTTRYQVVVSGNQFANSPRYGLYCVGVDAILMGNTFMNNTTADAVLIDGNATGAQATDVTQTPAGTAGEPLPGSLATGAAP
jgi:hypothetical protein